MQFEFCSKISYEVDKLSMINELLDIVKFIATKDELVREDFIQHFQQMS